MCYSLQKGANHYSIRKQILAEALVHVPALYDQHPNASVEQPPAVELQTLKLQPNRRAESQRCHAASTTAVTSQPQRLKRFISLSLLHAHILVFLSLWGPSSTTHSTGHCWDHVHRRTCLVDFCHTLVSLHRNAVSNLWKWHFWKGFQRRVFLKGFQPPRLCKWEEGTWVCVPNTQHQLVAKHGNYSVLTVLCVLCKWRSYTK